MAPYFLFIWILPAAAAVFAIVAGSRVRSVFARYQKVGTASGMTGAEVARLLLRSRGLEDEVKVEATRGMLTDHYDPRDRTLRLSEAVYKSTSVAALGVAAHETGHALQHADSYAWLNMRSALCPVVSIGSKLSSFLIPIGFLLVFFAGSSQLAVPVLTVAAYGLAGVVLFSLITLPVEIDASSRAVRLLDGAGVLVGPEVDGARQVLRAAAWTYVASAAVAIMELMRVLMLLFIARDR